MSLQNSTAPDSGIEACMDEMNDFVATLRYPPQSIAVAQSVHLHSMLCALVYCNLATPDEIKKFVQEFAHDVLEEIAAEQSDEPRPASQPVSLDTNVNEKVPGDAEPGVH
jgi:hypothetical protein